MIRFSHFQTFPKIPKKSQKFQSRDKIPKRVCPRYQLTMTIVTITERIWFPLATNAALKNALGRRCSTQTASIESVSLRRLVGVARGPIGSNRSNRLKASPMYSGTRHSIGRVSAAGVVASHLDS